MAESRLEGTPEAATATVADPEASVEEVEEILKEYFSGKRAAVRTYKFLDVRVKGRRGVFHGMAVDISATGMLLRIIDKDFAHAEEVDRLMPYTARVWFHFENGLDVAFDAGKFRAAADVVRVTGYCGRGRGLILIGCRFREPLTDEQCASLGIEAGPDVAARTLEPNRIDQEA